MIGKFERILCGILCTLLVSACATGAKNGDERLLNLKVEDVLAEASAASNAGQADKALTILKKATTFFPADKAPWLQIAQMKFDSANYGEAIIGAQEVLQRDPRNTLANSIVAVSGLRLSTKALADLSRENNLSGPVRTEAQDLAKLLRESLGEAVLVPVPLRVKAAPRTSQKYGNGTHKMAARANQVKAVKASGSDSESETSNPFGALK
jgi:tetratricopeptide (TPR) repeat protein